MRRGVGGQRAIARVRGRRWLLVVVVVKGPNARMRCFSPSCSAISRMIRNTFVINHCNGCNGIHPQVMTRLSCFTWPSSHCSGLSHYPTTRAHHYSPRRPHAGGTPSRLFRLAPRPGVVYPAAAPCATMVYAPQRRHAIVQVGVRLAQVLDHPLTSQLSSTMQTLALVQHLYSPNTLVLICRVTAHISSFISLRTVLTPTQRRARQQ